MISRDIRFHLQSIDNINTLVGENIFPVKAPTVITPSIVYNVVSTTTALRILGGIDRLEYRLRLSIFTLRYTDELLVLMDDISNAFDSFTGVLNPDSDDGGTQILSCLKQNARISPFTDQQDIFAGEIEFLIIS